MFKVDLHTHSIASHDGGITPEQYAETLQNERLDYIAITDHDRIDFAQGLQKALGDRIIVGQEVTTADGDIIGLFLKEPVEPGLRASDAAKRIHEQGGLVYIPHPFETVRSGIQRDVLDEIQHLVDIVEVHNGRAVFQNKSIEALTWAKLHKKPGASSSDAHGVRGLGYGYSIVEEAPARGSLVDNLTFTKLSHQTAPLHTLLYPKINTILKKTGLKHA